MNSSSLARSESDSGRGLLLRRLISMSILDFGGVIGCDKSSWRDGMCAVSKWPSSSYIESVGYDAFAVRLIMFMLGRKVSWGESFGRHAGQQEKGGVRSALAVGLQNKREFATEDGSRRTLEMLCLFKVKWLQGQHEPGRCRRRCRFNVASSQKAGAASAATDLGGKQQPTSGPGTDVF